MRKHRRRDEPRGTRFARARERGAALVETALIIPLALTLVFGIIEFAGVYTDSTAVNDAARAGGRTGSAQAQNPEFAVNAANAAASALNALPADAPEEIWIYKANIDGYPGPDGNTSFDACNSNCIRFLWLADQKRFDTANDLGGGWNHESHQICEEPYDQIGVFVKATHDFITNLVAESMALTDKSVFRFEPKPSTTCAGT